MAEHETVEVGKFRYLVECDPDYVCDNPHQRGLYRDEDTGIAVFRIGATGKLGQALTPGSRAYDQAVNQSRFRNG